MSGLLPSPASPRALPVAPLSAVNEVLLLWVAAFGTLLLAFLVWTPAATLIATVGFLYFPLHFMRRRGEDYADYGVTLAHWRTDLKLFSVLFALTLPLYGAGFLVFFELLPLVPDKLQRLLSPYVGTPSFAFRLPPRFGEWVIHHLFVVALPEEFFYRGYLYRRLRDAWPQGRVFLGGRLGPAFWLTALLFALGHLAIFQAWRVSVFFPALVFAWMRDRTRTIVGATLYHAACNLLAMVMHACFFG